MPGSYVERLPSQPLAPFIECIWTRLDQDPAPQGHRVLPDGCIDILLQGTIASGLSARVVGTMTRPLIVPSGGPSYSLGVRFKPGAMTALFDMDAGELTDRQEGLLELDQSFASELEHRVNDQRSLDAQCACVQDALLQRLAQRTSRVDPYVRAVVARIQERRGDVRIEELSQYAGVTRQHLSRLFLRHVGLPTKAFARMVRFRAALQQARERPDQSWVGLAAEFGYADQSHLIAEFSALGGQSPSRWVR